jgi:superfamily II DNA or RNA helicase
MTMKTLALRDYQKAAVEAVHTAWAGGMKRPAVVLPTGTGKTIIFSALAQGLLSYGRRPFVLVHRDELVRQSVEKLAAAAPGASIGVIKGQRDEFDSDIVVASVQTLGREDRLRVTPLGGRTAIVDECHHAAADSYRRILERVDEAVGFTATMARGDGRALGEVWDKIVYRRDILDMIRAGYLVNPRGQAVQLEGLDLSKVRKSAGDFADGALADAMVDAHAFELVAEAYKEHATTESGEYRRGVAFWPTVEAAQMAADAFETAGIPSAYVVGSTPTEERQGIYAAVREGADKVIHSCMVLTEGFDLPELEVAVMARPTQMAHLYVQMAGRVLRPAPWSGKQDALILDVVGVTEHHKLRTLGILAGVEARPEPDETLVELVERDAEEAGQLAQERERRTPTFTGAVDLFASRASAWLQTSGRRGVWFLPTRSSYIFLWPAKDGSFAIGRTATTYAAKGPGAGWLLDQQSFPLEMAMAWAEEQATEIDPSVSSRDASWRKTRRPSDAQIGLAEKLGINGAEQMTRSELSDALSVHYATKCLDR